MTKVSKLLAKKTPLVTVRDTELVKQAAERLHHHHTGALPVVGPTGRLVGVISERDVIRCLVDELDLGLLEVCDVMSKQVIVAVESDDLEQAMSMMIAGQVRHLPVMQKAELVGFISMADVLDELRSKEPYKIRYLRDYLLERA